MNQELWGYALGGRDFVDPLEERNAINRVNPGKGLNGQARLVRLQVANEVPPDLRLGRSTDFL